MTRQAPPSSASTVSRIVSCRPRRKRGSGSIFRDARGWIAVISTTQGKRKRRALDYPDAKRKLAELKREHRAILPAEYRPWRRIDGDPKYRGIRPSRRFSVLERDGFRCVYCGASAKDARLTVDHRIAVANGGTDALDNLVTACEECNLGKGARSVA